MIDREEVVSGLMKPVDKVAGEDTADRGVIQGREEEIEDKLTNMPFVSESIVVDRSEKLVALIYPDADQVSAENLSEEQLNEAMANNLKELNQQLPAYSQLTSYELYKEEFEKTPKRSIKRFLYQ